MLPTVRHPRKRAAAVVVAPSYGAEATAAACRPWVSSPRHDSLSSLAHAADELRRRLSASGYRALRAVEIDHSDGALWLRGRVPSFYLKQVAQESARSVAPDARIVNRLTVRPS